MRAAVLRSSPGDGLDVVDTITLAPLGRREVRVRIHATGLCHSDVHALTGEIAQIAPAVLGHEGAGEIVEVGPDVTDLAVGDHVVVVWSPPCGRCVACVDQQSSHLCVQIQFTQAMLPRFRDGDTEVYGFAGTGTFAEELILSPESCIVIDDDVPWEIASLIGCGVTTGVGAALNAAEVRPGDTCVVFGCGGVGMAVIQGCRIAGASMIVAVDRVEAKLDLARSFGATHAVLPDDLKRLKRELVQEAGGFDHAFEVIGLPATVRAAYDAARRGGKVIVVGVGGTEAKVEFNLFELFFDEKTIRGSYYGSADVRASVHQLLRLWRSGALDLERMITDRIGLDGINDAIAALRRGDTVRTVITMDA